MRKMRRIAFIKPPRKSGTLYCALPLGLISIASNIKQHGYEPIFIDLYLYSINRKFYDIFKEMAEKILSYNPDVVGFSVLCNTLPATLLIAEQIKIMAPQIPIILGGPEVSFEEIEMLETFKQVDIVVRGEGEITLVEVLKALEKKMKLSDVLGITFREENQILRNPDRPFIEDLDTLPFLDLSIVPHLDMYAGLIEAGRGCPYQCTFCSTCRMWKRNLRVKSPQRLVQELEKTRHLFKNQFIEIIHDHLLASRKFANEFLSLMADKGIAWACNSRLDALDEERIKQLRQAGCKLIHLGIESGSSEMQKKLKKNLPLEKLPKLMRLLSQNGIEISITLIIGFPDETEKDIDQTLLMALNLQILFPSMEIPIFLFTYLKGSELLARTKGKTDRYEFRETHFAFLATTFSGEVELVKKFPHVFPSFYHIGDEGISPNFLQKLTNLFLFMVKTYARQTLLLLEYLSLTPCQLGKKLVSFFDKEEVAWDPTHGRHFPQYMTPLRRFIKKNADHLYNEFFWWDEKFKKWDEAKKIVE